MIGMIFLVLVIHLKIFGKENKLYSNGLERLWFSSMALRRRFGLMENPPNKELRKLSEEFVEFVEAVTLYSESVDGFSSDFELREKVAEELLDMVVCAMNAVQQCGLQFKDIEKMANQVAQKNDNKDYNSHAVYNGMIVKRSALMEIKENDD